MICHISVIDNKMSQISDLLYFIAVFLRQIIFLENVDYKISVISLVCEKLRGRKIVQILSTSSPLYILIVVRTSTHFYERAVKLPSREILLLYVYINPVSFSLLPYPFHISVHLRVGQLETSPTILPIYHVTP